ncbi:MAG TPA: nucleotide exchange factor GrpE [Desulfobacterales bacterium]|nr:nucleotide exchange factor GrpE [Desulfobacterales bacterium]
MMKKELKNITETEKIASTDHSLEKTDTEKQEQKNSGDTHEEMAAKLKSAEQETKETYDRLLRVSADFENYKKRMAREKEEFRKFANESLIKDLLPAVDNLERAIDSSCNHEGSDDCLMEGILLTRKEILKVFDKFGVRPIESLGKAFDPAFHQAFLVEETDDHPENTVFRELQKGYMIHDRLLRPSMVVVSKAKGKKR